MKAITKYVADDGSEFETEDACAKYEKLSAEINWLLSKLSPRPSGTDFQNGGGYLQHDAETFRAVKVGLLQIAKRLFNHPWIDKSIADDFVHPSYVGRLIDEANNAALWEAWQRVLCTDAQAREWGQPYFTSHQDKAQQVQLN